MTFRRAFGRAATAAVARFGSCGAWVLFIGRRVGALGLRVLAFGVAGPGAVVTGGEDGGAVGEGADEGDSLGAGGVNWMGVEDGEAEIAWEWHRVRRVGNEWIWLGSLRMEV